VRWRAAQAAPAEDESWIALSHPSSGLPYRSERESRAKYRARNVSVGDRLPQSVMRAAGMMLGIELVKDRSTKEPDGRAARAAAAAIVGAA
jgi:hypothetical protein